MLTDAEQNCASSKIGHLSDCTKLSLVTSVIFQSINSSTGHKQNFETFNCTDKAVPNYVKIHV